MKLAEMGVDNIVIGALNAAFFAGASLSAVAAHRIVSGSAISVVSVCLARYSRWPRLCI